MTLCIEAPAIETAYVNVVTCPVEPIELPHYREALTLGSSVYYGAEFEHRARHAKPIVGTVRDKDTGEPLAGVRLRSEPPLHASGMLKWVETTSDADGHYRLTGVPRTGRTEILAIPPDDQPYLLSQLKPKDLPDRPETNLDFAMKRGLWIEGRVTDLATGEPVQNAAVFYYVFTDNPHAEQSPGLSGATRGWIDSYYISLDGSFRRVGLPGRGLIAVRVTGNATDDGRYRFGMGAEKIEGGTAMRGRKLFQTSPSMCYSGDFNAVVEVRPGEDQDRCECNVTLDPGARVTGTVFDPDGRPLIGTLVWGSDDFGGPWAHEPLQGSTFEAEGYDAAEPRQMFFLHKERSLAGHLTIRGKQPGELTVRLQPWAAVSGRVLNAKGEPMGGLEVQSVPGSKPDNSIGPVPRRNKYSDGRHYTDNEGRFKIEGLVPGVSYSLGAGDSKARTYTFIVLDTVFEPGEVRDVGDVRLEDVETLRERLEKRSE